MKLLFGVVPARKSVKQVFHPSHQFLSLMETFRQTVNDCIRIGLEENKTSMKSLSLACYHKLEDLGLLGRYRLCAISRAAGILAKYRKLSKKHKMRKPYCNRPMLISCYGLRIVDGKLRMPGKLSIPLNKHTLEFLSQPRIEVRSVTLTPNSLSISVLKKIEMMKPTGILGIDMNLDNITLADTEGKIIR